MLRTPLIAANWKMNPAPESLDTEWRRYHSTPHVDVVVFPCVLDIYLCLASDILTGAQAARPEECGAFTGDVSMAMIKAGGCTHVLCGHSERRAQHGETDEFVAAQAKAALALGLFPVVCIGETGDERENNQQEAVIRKQLQLLPAGITIAYEPVWAIGTGKSATPAEAQEMHAFIRSLLPEDQKEPTRILYGGSMNANNAEALLLEPDIDGGLVGGASLDPLEFTEIVTIAGRMQERL